MFEYFIGHVLLSKLEGKLIYDIKSIVGAGQASGERQSTRLRHSGSMVSPEALEGSCPLMLLEMCSLSLWTP